MVPERPIVRERECREITLLNESAMELQEQRREYIDQLLAEEEEPQEGHREYIDQPLAEYEELQEEHRKCVRNLEAEHEERLEHQQRELQEGHVEYVRNLEAEYENEKYVGQVVHGVVVASLERIKLKEISDLRASHQRDIEALQEGHMEYICNLMAENGERLENQQRELQEGHRESIHHLKARHEEREADLQRDLEHQLFLYQKGISELQESHRESIHHLKAEYENEKYVGQVVHGVVVASLERINLKEISDLRASHQRVISDLRASHQNDLDNLRRIIDEDSKTRCDMAREISGLRDEITNLQKKAEEKFTIEESFRSLRDAKMSCTSTLQNCFFSNFESKLNQFKCVQRRIAGWLKSLDHCLS